MATSRKRSSGSTPISKTAIDQATSVLKDLPEKEKDTLSLRDAVELLHESILDSLSKGYNHEEVAAMLTQKGVPINAPSLKYYLTALRRKNKAAGRGKVRRTRRTKNADDSDSGKTANSGKSGVAGVISYLMEDASGEDAPRKRTRKAAATEEAAPTKRRTRSADAAKPASTTTKSPTRSAAKSKAAPSTSTRTRKKAQ